MRIALVVVSIILGLYFGYTPVMQHLKNSDFEETVNKIINEIDGTAVLDMNGNTVKQKIIEAGRSLDIPLKEEDVNVTWERNGDEILVVVDLNATYLYDETETNISFLKEATIAIDVAEEQRRVDQAWRNEEKRREAAIAAEDDWREKCDEMGGEYDGMYCTVGSMQYGKRINRN